MNYQMIWIVGDEEGAARFDEHIHGAAEGGLAVEEAREEGHDALNLAALEEGHGDLVTNLLAPVPGAMLGKE